MVHQAPQAKPPQATLMTVYPGNGRPKSVITDEVTCEMVRKSYQEGKSCLKTAMFRINWPERWTASVPSSTRMTWRTNDDRCGTRLTTEDFAQWFVQAVHERFTPLKQTNAEASL